MNANADNVVSLDERRARKHFLESVRHRGAQHHCSVTPARTTVMNFHTPNLDPARLQELLSLGQYELAVLVAVERSSYWDASQPDMTAGNVAWHRAATARALRDELTGWWDGTSGNIRVALYKLIKAGLVQTTRFSFRGEYWTTREGQVLASQIPIFTYINGKLNFATSDWAGY